MPIRVKIKRSIPPVSLDALVLKDHDLFFVSPPSGILSIDEQHGYGLYYRDCRYLNGYVITFGKDVCLKPLVAPVADGRQAVLRLHAPEFSADGQKISKEALKLSGFARSLERRAPSWTGSLS